MSYKSYSFDEIEVGMTASASRTITEGDVIIYAGVSGDLNPIHMDEAYAMKTPFHSRIAHGGFAMAMVSAVLGMQLPGPGCIYISQQMDFLAPIRIGDTVQATVTVIEKIHERKRIVFRTTCESGGKTVADGKAVIKIPS